MCNFTDVYNVNSAAQFIDETLASNSIHFDGFVPYQGPANVPYYAPLYNEKTVDTVNQIGMDKAEQILKACLKHVETFKVSRGGTYHLGGEWIPRTACFVMIAYPKYKLDKWYIKVFNVVKADGTAYPVVVLHRADEYSYTL